MNAPYNVFPWHVQRRSARYFIGLGLIGITILAWCVPFYQREYWWSNEQLRLAMVAGLVCGFFLLVEQTTLVESGTNTVMREGRLFGWLRVWRRHYAVSDFGAVRIWERHTEEGGATIYVELMRPSGGTMEVCCFAGEELTEAQSVAWRLCQATGLGLVEGLE